jgi:hypothetical protein
MMVCLKGCSICGITILDKDLCPECMEAVSEKALRGESIDRGAIKKKVDAERLEKMHRDTMARLRAMSTCPSCGNSL